MRKTILAALAICAAASAHAGSFAGETTTPNHLAVASSYADAERLAGVRLRQNFEEFFRHVPSGVEVWKCPPGAGALSVVVVWGEGGTERAYATIHRERAGFVALVGDGCDAEMRGSNLLPDLSARGR